MLPAYSRLLSTSRDSGLSALFGTVAVAATPSDVSISGARVQLLRSIVEPSRVRELWSDAAGVYRFEGIAPRLAADAYTVIGYDPTGSYDPVAKTNCVPTPMPPSAAEHP